MKRHTIIFLALSIMVISVWSACQSDTKEVIFKYPTGEISQRHTEVKGQKQGKMTEYFKDGKVKTERNFENGQEVGRTVHYYPGGAIKEAQHYEGGKLQGGDTVFYETGTPQFLRNWNHGVLDGYIRKWGEDGVLIYEAKYANDKLVEVKGEAVHPDSLLHN
jgi:antitoxin component YwqK of YwqJK toxin-antitoxin module